MTEYTISASIVVRTSAAELMRWLTAPELMTRWIMGADRVESPAGQAAQVGAVTELTVSAAGSGARYGSTFRGVITELTGQRLVRCYTLGQARPGVVTVPARPTEYQRVVVYDLADAGGAVGMTCTARTSIPGLAKAPARMGSRSEQRSLARSLDRLRACAEGGGPALTARLRDGSFSAQAL